MSSQVKHHMVTKSVDQVTVDRAHINMMLFPTLAGRDSIIERVSVVSSTTAPTAIHP